LIICIALAVLFIQVRQCREPFSSVLDLQPNNILVQLQDLDSILTAVLQSQTGREEGAGVATIVLPSGEKYNVVECCSLPLQVSPSQDWNIQVKIADLGMGERHQVECLILFREFY
jgi:hypothetical protein